MSHQAVTWVLDDAPNLPAEMVGTLLALAESADKDGRYAYPSQARLAARARKSARQIRRDLAELECLGLIRRGDQSRVRKLPPQYRPIVWDLAMPDRSPTSGLDRTSEASSTDAHDLADRSPTSYKPSLPSKRKPKGAELERLEALKASFIADKITWSGYSPEDAESLWWSFYYETEDR